MENNNSIKVQRNTKDVALELVNAYINMYKPKLNDEDDFANLYVKFYATVKLADHASLINLKKHLPEELEKTLD